MVCNPCTIFRMIDTAREQERERNGEHILCLDAVQTLSFSSQHHPACLEVLDDSGAGGVGIRFGWNSRCDTTRTACTHMEICVSCVRRVHILNGTTLFSLNTQTHADDTTRARARARTHFESVLSRHIVYHKFRSALR